MFRFLKRKLTAKGHGVHSPFAFHFITNILGDKLIYNHFADIENQLKHENIHSKHIDKYRLFFKIVNFLQPSSILQIGTEQGIDTLYLTSPTNAKLDLYLNQNKPLTIILKPFSNMHIINEIKNISQKYDLIFLKQEDSPNIYIEKLLDISNTKTCWIIDPLTSKSSRNFWNEIRNHPDVRVTFERTDFGVAFLNPELHKINYIV